MESRRRGNQLLANAASALVAKPRVIVAASGIGYYGSSLSGAVAVDERSPKGTGFLSEVSAASEAQLASATAAGIRTVSLRIAPVLSFHGGMLQKLYWPFYLCAGAVMGPGTQQFSWVTLPDVLAAIEFALRTPTLAGPVNVTSPNPVTNAEFTAALASALHRPALLRIPTPAIKAMFGEMGDETILASLRVLPTALTAAGFVFSQPEIRAALVAALAETK